jgi:hypothetical protein
MYVTSHNLLVTRNVTLALPDDLASEMDRYPQIRWSEVARRAFKQELARLEIYDRLFADSQLTEKDAVEIGRKIKRALAKKYDEDLAALRAHSGEKKPSRSTRGNA